MWYQLTSFVERAAPHAGAFLGCAAAGFVTLLVFATAPAVASQDERTERGEAILSEACASCHAIGKTGESPKLGAPPFRGLSEDYPVENLAESLAEGIMSGHPEMPVFVFEPRDIDAIIAYLQSIQVSPDQVSPDPVPPDLSPAEPDGPSSVDVEGS